MLLQRLQRFVQGGSSTAGTSHGTKQLSTVVLGSIGLALAPQDVLDNWGWFIWNHHLVIVPSTLKTLLEERSEDGERPNMASCGTQEEVQPCIVTSLFMCTFL